jgi:hypothetical protein
MTKTVASDTSADEYKCEHCGRQFVRPSTMFKHLCEQKRRWDERDRPANRIAFNAWLKFYEKLQPNRKRKDYRDFSSSAYYNGFMKFGTYCVDISAIHPLMYVEWLLKDKQALDNWTSDKNYTRYLTEHLLHETVEDAMYRTVKTLTNIADTQNLELRDVFRFVNPNRICQQIINGKISPWILYHSNTGIEFLSNLGESNRALIWDYIQPEKWQIKFKRNPEMVSTAKLFIDEIRGI